jgi:hypothetical protein
MSTQFLSMVSTMEYLPATGFVESHRGDSELQPTCDRTMSTQSFETAEGEDTAVGADDDLRLIDDSRRPA